MAFDQATRNRLQKFVGDARKLLTDEFIQQLQNTYGLDPVTGGIAALSDLPALSPSEQQTAQLLRDTLEHYLATSHKADPHKDKALVTATLERIVREQAFTVLNRLAALRMAEARQFVMESISQGYQSKGFQLYQRIAGSSLGETGQAYQHYLFSVFDELSLDLAVLFDRYSSQGRLFPRETVLLELLDLINHAELEMLWVEDETVGWIYQYFNSKEERKKMRDESQAPRNSRELAVRNQFFTPRHVVEFLTDNTLGRIWYEMTQGETALSESCQYLVRRPNEIFLESGELSPEQDKQEVAELSQEQLLQQTVYIQHRSIKDPRDIRMLDPACGSMHFGLYAFDLFEQIYSEAWDIEVDQGRDVFLCEEGSQQIKALSDVYISKDDFLADVPRLIIEHNIHGVDIDPRAAQIAGLSLWLRAQKTWSENGIKPNERPQVLRSNIVCAEPMPGETQLLKEFSNAIQPRVLGQLVEDIFEKMQLAGEAGTLLKIEGGIQAAIETARSQKDENVLEVQGGLFGGDKWEVREGKRYYNFGGVDENFWDEAEQLIMAQLERYAESAAIEGTGQKRLFASDTAKGFAFIDLCRKKFDVALMNPPFGEYSEKYRELSKGTYFSGGHDILTAFIERGLGLLGPRGRLGAITSRTPFYAPTTKKWREEAILQFQIDSWVDLGEGVLDDAMVETCAYSIEKNEPSYPSVFHGGKEFINNLGEGDGCLKSIKSLNYIDQNDFGAIEGAPLSYWIRPCLLKVVKELQPLNKNGVDVNVGLQTGDDYRFIRSWWEVSEKSRGAWLPHAKGGENQPFCTDVYLVVNWRDGGKEIKSTSSCRLNAYSRVDPRDILEQGLTFPYRTHRFSPALIESGVVTGVAGMGVYSEAVEINALSAILNSSIVNELIKFRLARRDLAPLYQAGTISPIPFPEIPENQQARLRELNVVISGNIQKYFNFDETTAGYSSIFNALDDFKVRGEANIGGLWEKCRSEILSAFEEIDGITGKLYRISDKDSSDIHQANLADFDSVIPVKFLDESQLSERVFSYFVGVFFGRWERDGNHCKQASVVDVEELISFVQSSIRELNRSRNNEFHEFPIDYLVKDSGFFSSHFKLYSKGRRQSPIYWPLQSNSGAITLWVYYPDIDDQTLFLCVNDFVEPKLANTVASIRELRAQSDLSAKEEIELVKLSEIESELKDFRDELLDVATAWRPNLNDGVQLNAAPLFKFFQHTAWKKKLKKGWEDLESGKFDWSAMAYNFWPERVLKKCYEDRSIAIAHGVEANLWEEVEVPAARGNGTKWIWQPKEMTEVELNEYIKNKIAKG